MASGLQKEIAAILADTIGAEYEGLVLTAALYGVNCAQCIVFFRHRTVQFLVLRVVIVALWMLETLHLILCIHSLYYAIVSNRGDIFIIQQSPWSTMIQLLPTLLIAWIVQHVWIWRAWSLNRSTWRTPAALVMALCSDIGFLLSMVWMVKRYPQVDSLQDIKNPILLTSLSFMVLNDSLASLMLCVILYRSRSGVQRTDNAVKLLMAYAVNTGILTSLGSIAILVTLCVMPYRLYYFAIYAVTTKVYLTSLLAMFNWQQRHSSPVEVSESTENQTNIQLTTILGLSRNDSCDDW